MPDRPNIVPANAAGGPGSDSEVVAYEPMQGGPQGEPETAEDAEDRDPDESWSFWDGQIKSALTHENRWRVEAQDCERLYFGPDNDPGRGGDPDQGATENRVNDKTALIHATIDVLRPLIYSETPQPIVRRRFYGDGKVDETALMAAEVGQRLADWILDTTDFDVSMFQARDDWLIAGRGEARALYKAEFGMVQSIDPATNQPVEVEVKTHEEVAARALEWRRMLFAPTAGWEQMPWIAFEVPMTRTQVEKRFGEDIAAAMRFDSAGLKDAQRGLSDEDADRGMASITADGETGTPTSSPFDTTSLWEIWSKDTQEVIWWSKGYTESVLDRQPDPLGLEKFYPVPRPLLATTKGQSLTPRPDIRYYEKRATEVETATKKLKTILDALSVSGLFPGDMQQEVKKLLDGTNQMIPVSQWIQFMEKGGTSSLIQWLPIEAMIKAAQALITMRDQSKEAMFEASGVSDVMRATSDPSETATAQRIKGQYAGLRLSDRQRRMAEFARDHLRIMLEIALEHFDTETIADITGLDLPMTKAEREAIAMQAEQQQAQFAQTMQVYQAYAQAVEQGQMRGPMPPPPEEPEEIEIPETSYEEVHERLRADYGRKVTLSIETDSTVLADEQADKEARIEFLSAFSQFVQQLGPMMQTGQFDMKTMKELLLFGVRGFPKSRTLEAMISSLPNEPQGEQPEDTQVQVARIKAEVDQALKQMDLQDAQADREHETKIERMKVGGSMLETAADGMVDAATPDPQPQQQGS
jgi:hypothetical protein